MTFLLAASYIQPEATCASRNCNSHALQLACRSFAYRCCNDRKCCWRSKKRLKNVGNGSPTNTDRKNTTPAVSGSACAPDTARWDKLRCNNVALPPDETPNRNPGHPLHGSLFRTENGAVSTCINPARGEAGSVKVACIFRGTMPDLWHESWTWAVCGLMRLRSDLLIEVCSS